MTDVRFPCVHCGQPIIAPAEWAGSRATCPKCRKAILVPESPGETPSPVPEQQDATSEAASDRLPLRTPVISLVDWVLARLRFFQRHPRGYQRYQKLLAIGGAYALLLAGILFAVQMTVFAVEGGRWVPLLTGLGGLVAAVALHYVAAAFISAGQALTRNNPEPAPPAFLTDCLGVGAFAVAVLGLLAAVMAAIEAEALWPILPAITLLILLGHLGLVSLSPGACLNVAGSSEKGSAGETALSFVTLLARCLPAMAPIVFGYALVYYTIRMLVAMVRCWSDGFRAAMEFSAAGTAVLAIGLSPIAFYVVCAFLTLMVDLCAAILRISRTHAANTQ